MSRLKIGVDGEKHDPNIQSGRGTRSGRLAQLVRALSSHGRGHRFEPCAAHSVSPRAVEFEGQTIFDPYRKWLGDSGKIPSADPLSAFEEQ